MTGDKINTTLYSEPGKVQQADVLYCTKYFKCPLYAKGMCLNARRDPHKKTTDLCEHGTTRTFKGYAEGSPIHAEFEKKFKSDETYMKLKEAKNFMIMRIERQYIIHIPLLHITDDGIVDNKAERSKVIYVIPKKEFTSDFLNLILSVRPRSADGKPIEKYQNVWVPAFLRALKNNHYAVYRQFVKEYPEYKEMTNG